MATSPQQKKALEDALKTPPVNPEMAIYKEERKTVEKLLEAYRGELASALPSFLPIDRLIRVALVSMMRTPKLLKCSQASLIGSLMTCGQLGLLPDNILGQAYLIPFEKKQGSGNYECQVIIGYKGLTTLAMRSGLVQSVHAVAVYDRKTLKDDNGDIFSWEKGLKDKLIHKPSGLILDQKRITHFYGIVKLLNGGVLWEVMTRAQVEDIRDKSPNYKKAQDKSTTVWGQFFGEMGQKTVIRRVLRGAPLSPEVDRAIKLDELSEAGLKQDNALEFYDELKNTNLVVDIDSEVIGDEISDAEAEQILKREQAAAKGQQASKSTENVLNKTSNGRKAQRR